MILLMGRALLGLRLPEPVPGSSAIALGGVVASDALTRRLDGRGLRWR